MRFYIVVFSFFLLTTGIAQVGKTNITSRSNGFDISIQFNDVSNFIINQKNQKILKYHNAIDESTPGNPALPSKTFFIAIPPHSKIIASLSEQNYNHLQDVGVSLNPFVELKDDSSIITKESEPALNAFSEDQFPISEIEILGYTWLRDFYCAIVRINTHKYYWKKKEITELISANLKIDFDSVKPFEKNVSSQGEFDKSLREIILNYDSAVEFRSFAPNSISSDSTGQWIDYSKQYLKMGVAQDGIYHISFSDLTNSGIDINNINPKTFKLFSKGLQVPIYVSGEEDLIFDENDYIEFWATKNYESDNYRKIVQTGEDYINYLNKYSDTTIIWLTWGGDEGLRTNMVNNYNFSLTDTIFTHKVKFHFESDVRLWYYDDVSPRTQLTFWQEHKVWTWRTLQQNQTSSFNFVVSNAVPNTEVKTIARLISNAIDNPNNTHKFSSGLNSLPQQDTIEFNYRKTVNLNSTFSSNSLINGTNTYKIFGLTTNAAYHRALIDWADIEYERFNFASNDSIKIILEPNLSVAERIIRVDNILIDDSLIILWKITDGHKKFVDFHKAGSSIFFSDFNKGGDEYIVIKNDFVKKPKFYQSKTFTNLRDVTNGADYLLISNRELNQSVINYYNFISENYPIRSKLVYVDDIFDEFSFGQPEPEAIKRFIEYTHSSWQLPKPSYLTLIGDAKYDYKNVFVSPTGKVRKNLVPSYGFPVSDLWYATIDSFNANIPQMYVGRIPAENNAQVEFYLNKHQKYKQRVFDDWNKTFLFFSGGDISDATQLQQIYQTNQNLFNSVVKPAPVGGIGTHFYKTANPQTNFGPYTRDEVREVIKKGSLFISYIGHSGTQTWDNGVVDVQDISNSSDNKLPLITDFGCSTGKFAEADVDAFGELFICGDADGQAIAYLGNSSWGYLSTSLNFPGYFYRKLLFDSSLTLGQAHFLAKIQQFNETGFSEVNRVFNYSNIFFGDPIIKFRNPTKPNFVINQNTFSTTENEPNDLLDSVEVNFIINNWGKVINDSLLIKFSENWNDSLVFEKTFKILIPLFEQKLSLTLPITKRVGEHTISLELDPFNELEEIYENDNTANFVFNVFSTSLKPIITESFYSTNLFDLNLLNPLRKLDNTPDKILFSFSDNVDFIGAENSIYDFDTVSTTLTLSNYQNNKRYWFRAKINSDNFEWSKMFSFKTNDKKFSWFIDKDHNQSDIIKSNIKFDSSKAGWSLETALNTLEVFSAGFSDGEFGSILFNGEEKLPTTFYWGIATAEINPITLVPSNFKYFLFYDPSPADSMKKYLDNLPIGSIVAMAICSDGAQAVLNRTGGAVLRQTIKEFGSIKIDSVQYRNSWSLIGVKGAEPGSVPESFKKTFFGVAASDSSKFVEYDEGFALFPKIGKSIGWLNVFKLDSLPVASTLSYLPLGIKSNQEIDTLSVINFESDSSLLAYVNSDLYPEIRLLVKFNANNQKESPLLKSIGVNYIPPPELAINYQVVSLSNDSVYQGNPLNLFFEVHNVGKSKADSFNVKVELVKPDKSKRVLLDSLILSLNEQSKIPFNLVYNSNQYDGYGNMTFLISIDTEQKQLEIFEDNNIYEEPFFVIKDSTISSVTETSITALFDGTEIMNGDFVSAKPSIEVNLSYPVWFPIYDTTAVDFYLNTNRISYEELKINYDTINRIANYQFSPALSDGDYSFRIYGVDVDGKMQTQPGFEKYFIVQNRLEALNVYNYPNPFSEKTYFTFLLTQIPERIKIKIFTIAGRLIKEIEVEKSQLTVGFNRIEWNGKDQDEDNLANGVYIYKLIAIDAEKKFATTQKLVIAR